MNAKRLLKVIRTSLIVVLAFSSSARADICAKCSGLGRYFKGFSVVTCDRCGGDGQTEQPIGDQLGVNKGMGYQTNKFDLKRRVEGEGNDRWAVAWADDIAEKDVAQGVVAAGVSALSANPGPFALWVENLVDRTLTSLGDSAQRTFTAEAKRQAQNFAMNAIKEAIATRSAREVFKQFGNIDFKAGAINYSGRNFAGNVTVSTTWGIKPYVAFRIRGAGAVGPQPINPNGPRLSYYFSYPPIPDPSRGGILVFNDGMYSEIGNGKWLSQSGIKRASDGQMLQRMPDRELYEQQRGPDGIVLKSNETVPIRISTNGVFMFRNYPNYPIPPGVDPNRIAWWHTSNGHFMPPK